MADLRPFRAHRPSAELVKQVASPPYDVVTTAQARALAEGNAVSFLHVSRPEIDLPVGTDEHADEVYAAGRKNLATLIADGILMQDAEPRLYVYAQRMGSHHQTGIVACASVADYRADRIKKHEKTRSDKENDRTRHILELGAHDEPVFLTYAAAPAVDQAVERLTAAAAPAYDFVTDDGVGHRLWVLEPHASTKLAGLFAEAVGDLYVADGHHRSAAAARAHQERAGDGREHDVFMAVVFPHDQMNIMAYNRVVVDVRQRAPQRLLEELRARLDVVSASAPLPEARGSFGIYLGGKWYRATALPGSFDASDPVARLDCQICQDQILGPVFGIADPRRDTHIDFVGGIHGAAELERRVDAGKATVAIALPATTMDQVMAVSNAGKVMPPKSTWFEPKLRSGLFVHTF